MSQLASAYLDHAATTPIRPVARAAMLAELEYTGNPSSLHAAGRRARKTVEESRESIADQLGCRPSDVVFTAGGTESNNIAIKGIYWRQRAAHPNKTRVLVSGVEHPSVLAAADWLAMHEGATVVRLPVDAAGQLDLDSLRAELGRWADETAVVSVMWANNELGTVQPVAEVAQLCASFGVAFHCDGVQAVAWCAAPSSWAAQPGALTMSAHKLGGPIGVAALVVPETASVEPLLHGGGQELGVRSGTLNAPAIAGFAAALRECATERDVTRSRVQTLRDDLIVRVQRAVPDVVANGVPRGGDRLLPGHAHLAFPGCDSDALLMLLDAAGVACSAGSACSAGVARPSHVLQAVGLDDEIARSSLRFTLGWNSTSADVDAAVRVLPDAVLRARSARVRQPIGAR